MNNNTLWVILNFWMINLMVLYITHMIKISSFPKCVISYKPRPLGWNFSKDMEQWNHDLQTVGGDDFTSDFIHLVLHQKSAIVHPFFIVEMQGIWFPQLAPYFHGILHMCHLSNFMNATSNAILHVLMFHMPRAAYTICNYFTKCPHH